MYDNLVRVGNSSEKPDLCKDQAVIYEQSQKGILSKTEDYFLNKDAAGFLNLFSKKTSVDSFDFSNEKNKQSISEHLILINNNNFTNLTSRAQALKEFKNYFKKFKKIEKVELQTSEINPLSGANQVELLVHFVIKGLSADAKRRQDFGLFKLVIEKTNKTWQPQSLKLVKFQTLINIDEPKFKLAKTINPKQYQRIESIRRGGYAIAVGDYNNDGNQDLLVGSWGPMEIFKGDGAGNFKKDLDTNLPEASLVKSAAFVDFDNDGAQDLVLIRFLPDNPIQREDHSERAKLRAERSEVLIYQNVGNGKFKAVPQELNEEKYVRDNAMPLAVGDYNQDGKLDIYVGYPGARDFTAFSSPNDKLKYGHKAQGIYLNIGGLKFKASKMASGDDDRVFDIFGINNIIYPHSSLAVDLDQNGTTDLVVVDDRANISPIYLNNGNSKFTESSKPLGVAENGWGMGAAVGDINNDGNFDISLSYVVSESAARFWKCQKAEPKTGLSVFVNSTKAGQKNNTFAKLNNGDFDFPGQALGGIEFLDYDSDGRQDIYVANGLWSGNDKKAEDIAGVVERALNSPILNILQDVPRTEKSYVMDVLANYKNKQGKYISMAGFQSNRLYKNLGNNQFVDVAYLENVDSIYDGYVIAKADFNNDGVQDFVLRNADPGTKSVNNPAVQIFMGQKSKANGIILKLTSKKSNLDAIGSVVKASVNGLPEQILPLIANNGCAQSQKHIYIALGSEKEAKKVVVKWPNGDLVTFNNLKAGIYDIIDNDIKVSKR